MHVAADDFGTGYSSLSSLIEHPVDTLKIDRSFIDQLPDAKSTAVVRTIVALTTALGAARALGCTHVQGYLLGRPMPIADLADRYAAGRA